MEILSAILVLGIMGAVFGLILAVASRVFAVPQDDRLEKIIGALPGANCGGCGFSGCAAYAQAVLDGTAKIGLCAVGGDKAASDIAEILGVKAEAVEKRRAFVRCTGGARDKASYVGISDCLAATKVVGNGPSQCAYGCLGFGNCAKACKYDAMHIENGVARVDPEACVGCMACVEACPRGLIVSIPASAETTVPCASKEKGAVLRKYCDNGCIGCRICEKACPSDAIHVTDNLAVIDYTKCTECGACAEKCPRHLIDFTGVRKAEA